MTTLSAEVSDVQTRLGLEVCPTVALPDSVTDLVLLPPPAGMPETFYHLPHSSCASQHQEEHLGFLASILISIHNLAENKSYVWGDVSEILKSKDLNRKLKVTKLVMAFRMFRDVLCMASPSMREELVLYLHAVVDLGYKCGGFSFYDHHLSFGQSSSQAHAISSCSKTVVSFTKSSSAATLPVYAPHSELSANPPLIQQTGTLMQPLDTL